MQAHRQRIDDLDRGDRLQLRPAQAQRQPLGALDILPDGAGVEIAAVLELHTFAQTQGQAEGILRPFPTRRELRNEMHVGISVDQLVADHRQHIAIRIAAAACRVELHRIGDDADIQNIGARR